ncbi:maleylpyruvate isomerase family mycothiol-dependent enzyme [Streptomyces sp. NPDC050534]|uniref:maleylpyruvate isomerase family mycothiol-dependent enzyme n=1 Tax=Streptomyces sp. NPDC050534 TaxID=3365625 RepID=UPI0037A231F2
MHPTAQHSIQEPLPDGLAPAIRQTAADIATLLHSVGDTSVAVPDSQWTLGEAAAHLALANELMADLAAGRERPYGDGTPQSLAAVNAHALATFTERRAQPLASMIQDQADAFLAAVRQGSSHESAAGPTLLTPLGPMNRHVLASYLLTHMLGHGYDLARALKRAHMIDRDRAALCLPFLLTAMPRVADPAAIAHLTARYTIRLRRGPAFGVHVDNGAVNVTPTPPERADCTILIEPVTFLLVALGRRNPWRAMAHGHILAWGRKPWLAPRFPTLFTAP